MDKVVLDRGEFINLIAERVEVPSDISDIMKYVEAVFTLQSDDGRPAYLFEVDMANMSVDDFKMLDEGLRYMKVAAVLVPMKSVAYLGEATPTSLGIMGKVDAARAKIRKMVEIVMKYGGDEDER